MSITDTFDQVSSKSNSEWLNLEQGINSIRIVTEPVAFRERYFKSTNKTEICYEGCGYAGKGVSTRFLCWAIDNKDAFTEDGKPKAKLFKLGWTVFEILVNKEKMNVAMGKPKFTFPSEKDFLIMKTGEKLKTSYSLEIADSNQHTFDFSGLALEDVNDILESMKKATKERHAKDGAPVLEEAKEELESIQIDEDF